MLIIDQFIIVVVSTLYPSNFFIISFNYKYSFDTKGPVASQWTLLDVLMRPQVDSFRASFDLLPGALRVLCTDLPAELFRGLREPMLLHSLDWRDPAVFPGLRSEEVELVGSSERNGGRN